ncbi:hypothetical protein L204_100746 [Cryptococcus depauperatus]|nr:hypothetical protein L204_01321 [Cryptococcus depauperatus CBS 7855]
MAASSDAASVPLPSDADSPSSEVTPTHPDPSGDEDRESLRAELEHARQTISQQLVKLSLLSDAEIELVQLKDRFAFEEAARKAVEAQLKEEKTKREIAEENVEMLRGQVEQARRGVMTLQKQEAERKRISAMSGLGLGFVGQPNDEELLVNLGEGWNKDGNALKRASMLSHRRVSSQSEPSDVFAALERQAPFSKNGFTAPRLSGGLRELRLGSTSPSLVVHPGLPGPPGPLSPATPTHYFEESSLQAAIVTANKEKTVALEETAALRTQLRQAQAKLAESEESRAATEVCLKALREFMALNEDGMEGQGAAEEFRGMSLPPLPTDKDADERQLREESKPSGWGFKLWSGRAPTQVISPSLTPVEPQVSQPATHARAISVTTTPNSTGLSFPIDEAPSSATTPVANTAGLGGFVSNWTKGVMIGPSASASTPPSSSSTNMAAGLGGIGTGTAPGLQGTNSRKLSMGGFFRRRETSTSQPSHHSLEDPKDKDSSSVPITTSAVNVIDTSLPHTMSPAGSAVKSEGDKEHDRRKSHGTTVTDLEEELGTPHNSLEDQISEDPLDQRDKLQSGELDRLEEVII